MRERAVGPPERYAGRRAVAASLAWASGPGPRGTPAPYWPTLGEGRARRPPPQHAHPVHRNPARGAPCRPLSRPRQGAAAAPRSPLPCCSPPSWGSCSTAKVRGPFPGPSRRGLGFCLLTGVLPPAPFHRAPAGPRHRFFPAPPPPFPGSPDKECPPPQVISRLLAAASPFAEVPAPHPKSPWPLLSSGPQHQVALGLENSWHLSRQVQKSAT